MAFQIFEAGENENANRCRAPSYPSLAPRHLTMGDDYEQTLLILKECFVYRIGPRPNAAGYK